MKILIPSLTFAFAALTSSCKSIPASASTAATSTVGTAALSSFPESAPGELAKGMSKQEVLSVLGKPSYQYVISEKEIWVYESGNFVFDKAKETALNMVPVVGPAASLLMDLKTTTENAKATVGFDCEGKVTDFEIETSPEVSEK